MKIRLTFCLPYLTLTCNKVARNQCGNTAGEKFIFKAFAFRGLICTCAADIEKVTSLHAHRVLLLKHERYTRQIHRAYANLHDPGIGAYTVPWHRVP